MSEENVALIRSLAEGLEGANLAAIDWSHDAIREALGGAYSPEIELTTLASGVGSGMNDSYSGVDGVSRYLHEWLEPFAEYHVESLDFIDVGNCVVVPTRQWGVGLGSGARVEIEFTSLYELRDGLVVRWHQYETVEEALADAERTG